MTLSNIAWIKKSNSFSSFQPSNDSALVQPTKATANAFVILEGYQFTITFILVGKLGIKFNRSFLKICLLIGCSVISKHKPTISACFFYNSFLLKYWKLNYLLTASFVHDKPSVTYFNKTADTYLTINLSLTLFVEIYQSIKAMILYHHVRFNLL